MLNTESFIRCFIFILLLFGAIFTCHKITVKKDAQIKFSDFYALKGQNVDVLFLGTSHILDSVIPMELWHHNGLTSYNMAVEMSTIPSNYWLLKNALKYVKPKVVALEITELSGEKAYPFFLHTYFDSISLSPLKIESSFDLFEDDNENALDMIFPFSRFHARWMELGNEDIVKESDYLMGFSPLYGISSGNGITKRMIDDPIPGDNEIADYLYKIIDLCRDNDIGIMFWALPTRATSQLNNDVSYSAKLSEKLGIPFLSPDVILESINTGTDFYNNFSTNSHTNFQGALKVTELVGAFLQDHFDFSETKTEQQISEWDSYYREYYAYKVDTLNTVNDISLHLLQCYDPDFIYLIEIYGTHIFDDPTYAALLKNLGIERRSAEKGTKNLFVVENSEVIAFYPDFLSKLDFSHDTKIGKISYLATDNGKKYQTLFNDQIIAETDTNNSDETNIRIMTLDKETHQLVDHFYWIYINNTPYGTYKR